MNCIIYSNLFILINDNWKNFKYRICSMNNFSTYRFVLIFFIISFSLKAQQVDELSRLKKQELLIKMADSLSNNRVRESIVLYNQANNILELDDFAKYSFAAMYGMVKNKEKVYEWLNAIGMSKFLFCDVDSNEYCILNDILGEKAFEFMHKDIQWKKFIGMKHKQIKSAYDELNKEVVKELKQMYDDDQKYRLYIVHNWDKLYESGHERERDSLFHNQDILDSINFYRFKELTKKFGWLGYRKFGRYSEILITHINKDFDFFLPLMIDAARKHDLEWTHVDVCMVKKMTSLLLTKDGIELDDLYFSDSSELLLPESGYQLNNLVHNLQILNTYTKEVEFNFCYKNNFPFAESKTNAVITWLEKNGADTSKFVKKAVGDEAVKEDFKLKVKVIRKK